MVHIFYGQETSGTGTWPRYITCFMGERDSRYATAMAPNYLSAALWRLGMRQPVISNSCIRNVQKRHTPCSIPVECVGQFMLLLLGSGEAYALFNVSLVTAISKTLHYECLILSTARFYCRSSLPRLVGSLWARNEEDIL